MTTDIRTRISLDGVPQVRAGAQQAAQSLSRVGDAADLTSRQARLLARNFGDAVRAIGGGASGPLGEAAQRVSQLGIAFGGLDGVAARVTPLVGVIGGLAAAAGVLAVAYKQGRAESDAYAKALILSGNAAGTTVGQLNELAKAQAAIAGSQGKAAEVLTQLAASGNVAAGELGKATAAAIRFERAGGSAADETVKKFIELGKDPLKALIKINEAENFLTRSVYETVKALEAQGKRAEAATVAQNAYADAVSGRSSQLEPRLGSLQKAWQALGDAASKAWSNMLNIGREQTLEEKLAAVGQDIAQAQRGVQSPGYLAARSAGFRGARLAQVAAAGAGSAPQSLVDEQSVLQSDLRLFRQAAERQRQGAAEIKAQIAADAKPQGSGGQSPYAALIGDLRKLEQTQEEELRTGGKVSEARKLQIRLVDQFADKAEKLTFAQRQAVAAEIALRVSAQGRIEELQKQIKAEQDYAEAEAKAVQEQIANIARLEEARLKLLAGIDERTQSIDDEAKAADVARASNISLAEAIERVAIAHLQDKAAAATEDPGRLKEINQEIAARERLATAIAGKAQRETSEKSAQELQQAYERAYEQISQGLTDALIQGGKSAADYIKGLFRTMILRPLLEPFVRPVAGVIAGATGSASAFAGTGAGGASVLDIFSAGKTLYEGFSSGFASAGSSAASLYAKVAESQLGARFGLSTLAEDQAGNIFLQQTAGSQATGSAIGAAAGAIAGGVVGVYGGRAISGGYAAFGGSGNGTVNAGTAIGAVVGSIVPGIGTAVGAAVGGVLGGLVNRLFGRRAPEVTGRSIEGAITGTNFTGSTVTDVLEKGGLFRSDKRSQIAEAITGDLDKALDEGAKALADLAGKYGAALGLPAEQLAGVTAQIKVKITDDAAENSKAIADALQQYADALLGTFADDVEPFRKSGETVAQTIERVGGALLTVNDAFELLGVQALQASIDGGKAALALADVFGGADTFAQAAGSFYQKFYSEGERADRATQQLTKTLGEFGLAVPATRDAYRQLVQEQLALGEAGYPAAAALLGLADTFDALRTAAGDSAQALSQVIQQRKDLETQLLELQGNTAELRARERLALDESNRALYDQVQALKDQKDAAKEAADAAKEAADAARDLAQRQRGIVTGADSIVGDFLSGDALARNRATRINEILTEGGITGGTIEGIIGSTREDIVRLWNSVGTAGREAILEAYGLWQKLDEQVRGTSRAVTTYRGGSLGDSIEAARLQTLSPADRVARLRSTEARLFGELATASDPVALAERLTGVITTRISEESRLQQELGDTTLDSLRQQLDAAKSLRDVVAGLPQFTASLKFSDLSPLSPRQQVEEARKLFESTLIRAQGGDQVAIGNLQTNAQAYIAEAAAAFGSDQRAAGVFDSVTRALDQFVAVAGSGLDPKITGLEKQITAAETTAANSGEMLAALLRIDSTLAGRVTSAGVSGPVTNVTETGTNGVLTGVSTSTSSAVVDAISAPGSNPQLADLLQRVATLAAQLGQVATNTAPIAAGVTVDREGYVALIARLRAIEAQQAQIVSQLNYATS